MGLEGELDFAITDVHYRFRTDELAGDSRVLRSAIDLPVPGIQIAVFPNLEVTRLPALPEQQARTTCEPWEESTATLDVLPPVPIEVLCTRLEKGFVG